MNAQPKAIFLDMDGTVLDHYNRISEQTQQVIKAIRAKGILVFIATGRTKKEVYETFPDGFEVDGVVTANGMVVYVGDEKIDEKTLSMTLIEEIIRQARLHKVYYEVHPVEGPMITLNEDKDYSVAEIRDPKPEEVGYNEWISRKQAIKEDIAWMDTLEDGQYTKMYFFSRDNQHIEKWIEVLHSIKQKIDFTMSTSSNHNVEVMVANGNKGTGIQSILDYFNLQADQCIAIGDSNNDIPMFELINHTVAMKNGTETIKEMADEVTTYTCDDDGVSRYLKEKLNI